jgi:hypothetical protein
VSYGYESYAAQPAYQPGQGTDQYEEGQFGAHMDPFVDDDPVDYDPNSYNDAPEQYGYDPHGYQQNYYSQGEGISSMGSNYWGAGVSAKENDNSLFRLAMG